MVGAYIGPIVIPDFGSSISHQIFIPGALSAPRIVLVGGKVMLPFLVQIAVILSDHERKLIMCRTAILEHIFVLKCVRNVILICIFTPGVITIWSKSPLICRG